MKSHFAIGAIAATFALTTPLMAQDDITPQTVRAANVKEIASGPFAPSFDALDGYQCPQWFRDAKFGIWSHWGPQAVPMMGDWYARRMYEQGGDAYEQHLKDYGHPSKSGYKDIIPLWKAEQWQPEQLMDLYVKAGAHYFVSMAVHHDNFDLWNSKFQPRWNATKIGPQRDIVGEWQKAAKKRGLPFGVSEHLGASFNWFQISHQADKTGPLAGVAYDGADPQWQDLYHRPSAPDDKGWLTTDAANHQEWFNRIKDLIDKYQPDLLYSDSGFPFAEDAGLPLVAHFYNANMQRNNGKLTAVYNCKQSSEGRWVQDLERGVMDGINPQPWQTDTSIGDWYYRRNDHYKTPATVIHMLCDIVSKNGNLLLNIVQRPDGGLDPQPRRILDELALWMPINGEAIFGTRPWTVFGEGAPAIQGGMFNESKLNYSSQDIRFTTKNGALYAIMLGWPDDKRAVIKALALDAPGITRGPHQVSLLGYNGELKWTRTAQGLEIQLPEKAPTQHAVVFKISGVQNANLDDAARKKWLQVLLPPPDQTVAPDKDGVLKLSVDKADLHGEKLNLEGPDNRRNIGFWDNASDWVSWDKVKIERAGKYRVSAEIAAVNDSAQLMVKIAGQTLNLKAINTGDWTKYQIVELGEINIAQAGTIAVEMRPNAQDWHAVNVRGLRLTPVQ